MTRAATGASRWNDLGPRFGSSVVLAAVGVVAIYVGGVWFTVFVGAVAGIVVWEIAQMGLADHPTVLGVVAGLCCIAVAVLPPGIGLPLVMVPALVAIGRLKRIRIAFALFAVLVLVAGYGLIAFREDFGAWWLVWLLAIVIATDIAGYFAGRLIGGPKFWPTVSPKKTWSGTVAGWIAAAGVGLAAILAGMAGPSIIGVSIALSMASQFGDIAESALKRHVGVKDSSRLLPGHGGFFDRFDGVLGAALFLLLVEQIVSFPPMAV